MKNISTLLFAATVGIVTLSGCTSPMGDMKPGAMGDMSMSDSQMKAMCEMHTKKMASTAPADRQAMMDAEMKGMSPEMREMHMAKMRQCM
jgi:outer membrane murein-binding lipoprotein Lpp